MYTAHRIPQAGPRGAARLSEASGARNVGPVKREAAGSFLHFEDPDGNRLYLWQMPKWG